MKNVNFVPKDIQRILSSHKIWKSIINRRCSIKKNILKNFRSIQRENTFGPATSLKRDSNTSVFLTILRVFKNSYFEEYM